MQLKQEVPTTDIAIQFLSTVASCDQMVTLRPLDDPSVEEVLCYTLQEEIRVSLVLIQVCVHKFPMASQAVLKSFYVDDCLSGADSVEEATTLQWQLHNLFLKGGFLLHKWNSNIPA